MISETGMPELYCLRWNNHKTNLLTVFDELFRDAAFTDVTLVCEGGNSIKCHKMVLAASSSYFQCLFSKLEPGHPVIVLKDVREREIEAILDYMYKGEVSITIEEVGPLLKVAEALKVKGLVGQNSFRGCSSADEYNSISTSSTYDLPMNRSASAGPHTNIRRNPSPSDLSNPASLNTTQNENADNSNISGGESKPDLNENSSPPHSTGVHQSFLKASYMYGKSADRPSSRLSLPIWPVTGIPFPTPPNPHTAAMPNPYYEGAVPESDIPQSKRNNKKLHSFNINRDTPILRTVLGQGQADSSQPMSLVCHNEGQNTPQSNGPTTPLDNSYIMNLKSESPTRSIKVPHSSSSFPQSIYAESREGVSSAIANYVPAQKPEWKRYKQYTRNDIAQAISAVREGMSPLKASQKFGVPSRTLYDKVKKLGIKTGRPFRRSNGSNGAAFPYGISGTGGAMMLGMPGDEEQGQESVLNHGFLQLALEGGSKAKFESSDREALSATSPAVPPHGLLLQRALADELVIKSDMGADWEAVSMNQGNNSGTSSASPPQSDRSPSPAVTKYSQHSHSSLTPSPPIPMVEDDYEDQVEDLSMTRRPEQQQSRVIMPPMSQTTATMLATCSDSARD